MQVIQFQIQNQDPDGLLKAYSQQPSLSIQANCLEDLHHEAREALIQHLGDRHIAYRISIRKAKLDTQG